MDLKAEIRSAKLDLVNATLEFKAIDTKVAYLSFQDFDKFPELGKLHEALGFQLEKARRLVVHFETTLDCLTTLDKQSKIP